MAYSIVAGGAGKTLTLTVKDANNNIVGSPGTVTWSHSVVNSATGGVPDAVPDQTLVSRSVSTGLSCTVTPTSNTNKTGRAIVTAVCGEAKSVFHFEVKPPTYNPANPAYFEVS